MVILSGIERVISATKRFFLGPSAALFNKYDLEKLASELPTVIELLMRPSSLSALTVIYHHGEKGAYMADLSWEMGYPITANPYYYNSNINRGVSFLLDNELVSKSVEVKASENQDIEYVVFHITEKGRRTWFFTPAGVLFLLARVRELEERVKELEAA